MRTSCVLLLATGAAALPGIGAPVGCAGYDEPALRALRAEWKAFRESFEPDYSDGSKHLLPKEGNRFAEPFVLVKDGKPAAQIVYKASNWWYDALYTEVTKNAAEELQSLVKMLTGVTLPVNPVKGPDKDLPAVMVGKGVFFPFDMGNRKPGTKKGWNDHLTQEMVDVVKGDLAALRGSDGFAIRRFGRNLHVYGADEKGALNGVYALVENNTDLIFARPDETIGTVYTPLDGNLSLVWGDGVVERPSMTMRGFWNICHPRYYNGNFLNQTIDQARKWSDANPVMRGGHNSGNFVPPSSERPDLHGLVSGKRGDYGFMLCFSNPALAPVFVDNVLRYADQRAMSRMSGIGISLDDTTNWCECRECAKPLRLGDGTVVEHSDPAFMSTQWFRLINRAADAVAEAHPGRRIQTLAYFQTAEPPKCPVSENLVVGYCPYMRANDTNPVFCEENLVWLDRCERWGAKVPDPRRLYLRGYDGLGLVFPRPLGHVHKIDWKLYTRHVCGFMHESSAQSVDRIEKDGSPSKTAAIFDYSAIEYYVMSRLMWNLDSDVEQLYKRFCWRAFREAAVPMERFYGTIRRAWMRKFVPSSIGEDGQNATKVYIIDGGLEGELRGYLDDALAKARHPASKALVERVKNRFEFFVDKVKNARTSSLNVPLVPFAKDPGFDDADWKLAATIDHLYEPVKAIRDNKEVEGAYPARIDLAHDGKCLYVRAVLWEDMEKISCTPRGAVTGDSATDEKIFGSRVEFFFGDNFKPGTYYLIQADNAGAVADYCGYDPSWNRKDARVETRKYDDRWAVLMKIPLPEIGMDIIADNTLKAAFIRLRLTRDKDEKGQSVGDCTSWKYSFFHRYSSFGTLTLQR
ncbi:MAG: DUF4838 domain-containing protein [Kiritimatiellae bacterium]|nr:DUF4838 domain-containing protein [Kiritimatiellia bacterium]